MRIPLICIYHKATLSIGLVKKKKIPGGHRGLMVIALDCDAGGCVFESSHSHLFILLLTSHIFNQLKRVCKAFGREEEERVCRRGRQQGDTRRDDCRDDGGSISRMRERGRAARRLVVRRDGENIARRPWENQKNIES